jgi:RNA polymerase sigma-70 factor (ECF subfamily)
MTHLSYADDIRTLPLGFPCWKGYVRRVVTSKETLSAQTRVADTDSAELEALIRAIAERRDRTAFGILFDRFAPRLKGFLLKYGTPESQADDLIQEVMLKVWRNASQFDPARGKATTWLFTITRNLRIDYLRKEIRPELDPEDPLLTPDPDRPADEQVQTRQTADRIAKAVSVLPDNQAEILRLSFFEELSHSEIADRLGLPLGTVKSRIRLTFGKLRHALSELDQ